MPRKSFEVIIEPKILVWARESIGRNIEEVANRLHVSENLVKRWESGEKNPTLTQVKTLAIYYKRPLAAFFLPEPPEELSLPKDFRTLSGENPLPLSPKTRLAMRRARRLQSLAMELEGELHKDIVIHIGHVSLSDDPEVLATKVRKHLGVSIESQFGWRKDNDAFNQWKKSIENLGVFVFQIPMPLEEVRAFSMTDGEIPVIILNTKDSIRARIFSLLHEFGHLLLNKGGICDPNRGRIWEINSQNIPSEEIKYVEIFCNHFAGAILVPKDGLLTHKSVIDVRSPHEWPDRVLGRLAKEFNVSHEVILRRLLIFGRTSRSFYQRKHEEWEVKAIERKQRKERKKGGRRDRPKECIQQNGAPFISLVLESYRNDRITCTDVADYLDIRLKYLPKVEKILEA
jgi:Zn-dependent peptidase ImmA (M78 family)/DNA-binding XRE family transcriptional regulator